METVHNIVSVLTPITLVILIALFIKWRRAFWNAAIFLFILSLVSFLITDWLGVNIDIAGLISMSIFIGISIMMYLGVIKDEMEAKEKAEKEAERKQRREERLKREAEEEAKQKRIRAEEEAERQRIKAEKEAERQRQIEEHRKNFERLKEIIMQIDDEKELDELKENGKKIRLVVKNIEEQGEDFKRTEYEFLRKAEKYGANLVLIKEKALNKTQVDTGEREEIETITKTGQPRKVKRAVMKDVEFYKIVGDFYKMAD
ncbi:hypothetical protein [uncultured Campylobacter sp.]|uniref:hypothetical protein n=1 Tax=uncultured Campylobacter sp. TaxID=218934 RepID=UPI0028E571D6|nr:hypothetical protein [uncultured Campylobacter sp.]